MALGNLFSSLRDKVENAFTNFFYADSDYVGQHAPGARSGAENRETPQPDPYVNGAWEQNEPQAAYQPNYQQPQQAAYQPNYQQPQQAAYQPNYQQPQQTGYQPNYQQPQQAAYQPNCQQPQQAAYQPNYQQPQQAAYQQNYQQTREAAPEQPAENNMVYFPGTAAQEEMVPDVRVINARGVGDCYSAIAQLRAGDTVILVMENIADPAEMRHYVDMLSGACYSLRGTITKLSRHGAYLICPTRVKVYVDAATNQLNSASTRAPQQRPVMGQQPVNGQTYAAPRQTRAAEGGFAAPESAYRSRTASPDPGQAAYYARPVFPDARNTATLQKQTYNGYMPDMPAEQAL